MYHPGDFTKYIQQFKVGKGCEFTHTSISNPAGSYYISTANEDEFMKLYTAAVKRKEDVYMTEKHKILGPIVIDLDFRWDSTKKLNKNRIYTENDIANIVSVYDKYIKQYFNVQLLGEYQYFVMEKPAPVIDKNILKDGIHIVIPDIISKSSVQQLLRRSVLNDSLLKDILDGMHLKNTPEDVIDEAVITKNNWQMYGSKKPDCEAYKVTSIYSVVGDEIKKIENKFTDSMLVDILSIRNKYKESVLKVDILNSVEDFEANQKMEEERKIKKTDPRLNIQNNMRNTCENLEQIEQLVGILSKKRAEKYDDWIRVGWCLRNIDHRLIDAWVVFSKNSNKYTDGECEKYWNNMKEDGLGIGTLHMWARSDNQEEYKNICEKDRHNLIYKSMNKSHYDIAKVVHHMFEHDYVCVTIKHNIWYEYKNHRWCLCDSAYSLREKLSTVIVKEYINTAIYYNNKAASEELEEDQKRYLAYTKTLNEIALKLKDSTFKENIMKECKTMFYKSKFEEKLDSKCHLIGFENGVYDLMNGEFRDGNPEDYISFSTKTNYINYDENHKYTHEIFEFLNKVFTKPDIKDFVLKVMASCLNGSIREERFHIWTGVGSNGKSCLIDLFEHAFGEYCCKLPVTLLTQKRPAANGANSELARTKGKRFTVLQEPSEDEKLNIGYMKELTGGDVILVRALYKEPFEFKPQFKMVLACNHLPNVPSDDGGTWRRIRVVEFTSKFTSNPDPSKENEFMIDTDLKGKFDDWKEHFMALLMLYYKKYCDEGIQEPDDVLRCTKDYQKNNDVFLEFVEQEIEKHDRSSIGMCDAWTRFTYWVKENAPHAKSVTKKTFITSLDKILGKSVHSTKVHSWKGFRFRNDDDGVDDEF